MVKFLVEIFIVISAAPIAFDIRYAIGDMLLALTNWMIVVRLNSIWVMCCTSRF